MEQLKLKPLDRRYKANKAAFDPDSVILVPPASYLSAVRSVLGIIDLDPCSSEKAQMAIDACSWYPAQHAEAALAEPWSGRVFCHPHPHTLIARQQIQKILRDYLSNRISSAIILMSRGADWLRQEPIILSFPLCIHYKRLDYLRFDREANCLRRFNPSFNSITLYLPEAKGGHFNDEKIASFCEAYASIGRVIITEDLGDDWQQDCLLASRRSPIKPVLTTTRVRRC